MIAPVLVLLPLLAGAGRAPAQDARSETLLLYVGGARAGTLTSVDEPLADGGLRLTRHAVMEVRRGDLALKLTSRSVSEVDADLTPRNFRYVREEAGGQLVNEGKARCAADGCTIDVLTNLGGTSSTATVRLPPGTTFGAAIEVQARRNLRPGARWEGKALLEELGQLQAASYDVATEAGGFVIHSRMAGVDSLDHVDAHGRTQKSEVLALNAVALPPGSKDPIASAHGPQLDVLAQSTWKGPVLPCGVKLVRYELTTREGDVSPVPEDRHQKVLKREKGRVLVEVQRLPRGLPETLTDAERATALAATPYEPLLDPRVKQAAVTSRGNATRTRDIVKNIILWVQKYVEDKDLSRAYAPATATLDTRRGDCTEHSVLASALLKANGIPTRLADGVIAFDGKLGYHEWVEVYLDGEGWVPADPTFGEPEAGPNRVKFATGSSDPADLMNMGLSAAQAFRGLRVSIVEFDPKQ